MHRSEIPIASPCGADWRTMSPSDTKRFCATCKKHVHDLSSMTKDEARALLASKPTEGLCVRYLYDARGGDVIFRNAVPAGFLVRAKRLAMIAALPMAAAACSSAMGEAHPSQPNPEPVQMMGAIAVEEPPTPPVPTAKAAAGPDAGPNDAPIAR